MASIHHLKSLVSPDSGAEDKVYGVDWNAGHILSNIAAGSVTSNELSAVSAQAASAISALSQQNSVDHASLANAISIVSNAVSNEISNRISADNALSNVISAGRFISVRNGHATDKIDVGSPIWLGLVSAGVLEVVPAYVPGTFMIGGVAVTSMVAGAAGVVQRYGALNFTSAQVRSVYNGNSSFNPGLPLYIGTLTGKLSDNPTNFSAAGLPQVAGIAETSQRLQIRPGELDPQFLAPHLQSVADTASNAVSMASNALSAVSALSQQNSVEHAGLSGRIVSTLDSLANVSVPSPTSSQVLKYNSAAAQWIASVDATAGGASVTSTELSAVSAQAASALSQALSVNSVEHAALSAGFVTVTVDISVGVGMALDLAEGGVSMYATVGDWAVRNPPIGIALSNAAALSPVTYQSRGIISLSEAVIFNRTGASTLVQGRTYYEEGNAGSWRFSSPSFSVGRSKVIGQAVGPTKLLITPGFADHEGIRTEIVLLNNQTSALSIRNDSLANAVSVVSNALSNEISNRASADNVLSNRISALSLNALANLSIVSPVDGNALMYNSATGEWHNSTPPGGGGSVTSTEVSAGDASVANLVSILSQATSVADAALSVRVDSVANGVSIVSAQVASVNSQLASAISQLNSVVSQEISVRSNQVSVLSDRLSQRAPWSTARMAQATGTQSIQNSAMADLSGMVVSVEAGKWEIRGGFAYSTSLATAQLRVGVSCPPMAATPGWIMFQTLSTAGQSAPGMKGAGILPASATSVYLSLTSTPVGALTPIIFQALAFVSTAGTFRIKAGTVSSLASSPLHIQGGTAYMIATKVA